MIKAPSPSGTGNDVLSYAGGPRSACGAHGVRICTCSGQNNFLGNYNGQD